MRLGLNLGYWGMGNDHQNLALAVEADRLGYDVVWVAEAYGSDAPSVLAWVGARTERIGLGSAVMQIPARTPAATAMTAATLDTLSQGRFRLGLGVSGPQVSEGWHGVRFAKPLGRTREYVDIVRTALRRERLSYAGEHYRLPLPDGPGAALKLTVHPVREEIPVYLASIGPKNTELAGEIADGWLAVFFSPEHAGEQLGYLAEGRQRVGKDLAGFDIAPTVPICPGDDWRACADAIRGYAALYVGGMGSRKQNFYKDLVIRMGFADAAEEVQRRYLERDHAGAMAALPVEFLDAIALLGPVERIADRMQAFAQAGVTTLSLVPMLQDPTRGVETLRLAVEALELAGVCK
ncbi:LLM class F420-dependent oxidoreductase [Actinoalloteichus hymeniacidonis]|uniref:F420-dependent oxidoreductase n=1 Tax=Actinoalloteichus hymeniacidonis TaxID=340345 RepID=A0AAC9HQQ8_9PSEU|nr:LLM class F420-dependent oxidoreductase [Actinoalloteichus hymeniacidonis]AOS63669.1 putative F420-dependent oxidoreductase [Actinoalloteichus hymeniacidonis]MBB5908282.1 F420-dependent oxidoreductase-like protein [Actinoalloteichus hymeniacidonis]